MSKQLQNYQYLVGPDGLYGAPLDAAGIRTTIGMPSYVDNAAAAGAGLAVGTIYFNTTTNTYVAVTA